MVAHAFVSQDSLISMACIVLLDHHPSNNTRSRCHLDRAQDLQIFQWAGKSQVEFTVIGFVFKDAEIISSTGTMCNDTANDKFI